MAPFKDDPSTDDPAVSAPVIEMITVANEYCLFFEKVSSYTKEDVLGYFQKIAPLLYLKGSLLPVTSTDETALERYVTEEQWEGVFNALRNLLEKEDIYYTYDHNFDPVQARLSENMADVYQEMKDFIMVYQKNTYPARHAAVSQLRDMYRWRWGPALINALNAVHHILYKEHIDPGLFQNDAEWLY